MQRARRLACLVGLVVAGGALAGASCKTFDFPEGTCRSESLIAIADDASAHHACATCLEGRDACDRVGRCAADEQCASSVKATHACILVGGTHSKREEEACKREKLGGADAAVEAFEAMSGGCRASCGIELCQLDPAIAQIGSATCDGCISAACCGPLNACYANRTCKLILDCVAASCGEALSFGDSASPDVPCEQLVDRGPPAGLPSCIDGCIRRFLSREPEGQAGLCLAARVALCGQRARGCDRACPGPARDAGAGD
ncbi:MAG: hypothetical protein KF819_35090 [Labilithrix sp.]|nr:hypothetical protein [Labilithrix sp.]